MTSLIQSIGENLLLRPATGSIALMTTIRLVLRSQPQMNENVRTALTSANDNILHG
jgi:hypothetical protein